MVCSQATYKLIERKDVHFGEMRGQKRYQATKGPKLRARLSGEKNESGLKMKGLWRA